MSISEEIGPPLYQLSLASGVEWAYSVEQMRIAQRDAERLESRLSKSIEQLREAEEQLAEAKTHLHWLTSGGEFSYWITEDKPLMCWAAAREWEEARDWLKAQRSAAFLSQDSQT